MTSYYRRFIRDYAKIAKPLTNLTRGEHAQIKASQSKKVPITLNDESMKSFDKLKSMLTTAELLSFPDFEKPFNLTTDASNTALGAVLSQGEIGKDKPIAYISRSLNKTEENYATNEKEMLAIVWALDNLRNYLYGAKKIRIYTDHQPLTFALGNRNFNAKLKRWKARIEEYNHELIYKPGMATNSDDTLTASEGQENDDLSSAATAHSAEQDGSDLIPMLKCP
ncbi:Retrovirus-related Pol polyprotein from transposon opus [Eumeta japonica]|uniref:Retrovirus-related Pol polyprotein from transposon opus n=1 Tax=Eumeta variegata TaxID=151549 RepID=A0A4C1SE11_EUMVA|nr:Retrovirus-related Pol polyprotein from transposon opus [Eumeta japonica]